MTQMTFGMIALALTFAVPFVAYLLSGVRFSEALQLRAEEHTAERLDQHREELAEPVKIHKLGSQGEPRKSRRAAA